MTRTHPHANDNRPQWFDALLVEHEPIIRKRSAQLSRGVDVDDLYQESVRYMLDYWYRFRRGTDFTPWVTLTVKEVRRDMTLKVKTQDRIAGEFRGRGPSATTLPDQESAAILSDTLRSVPTGSESIVAMLFTGHSASEIGAKIGCSKPSVLRRISEFRSALASNDHEPMAKAA